MPSKGYTHPGTRRISVYDPVLSPTFTSGLWRTCPLQEYIHDPGIGVYYNEPFISYDATNFWTLTQATAGSAAISTTIPGALTMNSGDTTIHHGAQIQALKCAIIPAANKTIWFEATVQAAFLTGELFIGLAASDTSLIASGAVNVNNHIAFTSVTGDGILLFDCDKAGVGATTTGGTLVASTNMKVGFVYDGAADTCQGYINGVATGTAIATADIPKLVVYPSFCCQNSGTDQETLTISGFRLFQLR